MMVLMPACLADAIASFTPFLNGSFRPISPAKVRSLISSFAALAASLPNSLASSFLRANPMTRRPLLASSRIFISSRSFSSLVPCEISRRASGAPETYMTRPPFRWTAYDDTLFKHCFRVFNERFVRKGCYGKNRFMVSSNGKYLFHLHAAFGKREGFVCCDNGGRS